MSVQTDVVVIVSPTLGGRFYPQGAVPDGVARPYGTYFVVSETPDNVLQGNGTFANSRVQIDVYADTYAAARAAWTLVRDAMASSALANTLAVAQDLFEEEAALYRVSGDFSIWHDS